MINKIYRLTDRKKIEEVFEEVHLNDSEIIVRPTNISICAADQRYYYFNRPKSVLKKKLPMALIHEAIGKVVYDPKGEFKKDENVILIPNIPVERDNVIEENYLRSSFFRSSGYDGFMQEVVSQPRERVVRIPEGMDLDVMSFSELMAVAIHAINRFDRKSHSRRNVLGVWGDGNLGFIMALFLKVIYNESKIIVFGKSQSKLELFSFVDSTVLVDDISEEMEIDHAFECVGGFGSEIAINQIIDIINPEGYLAMLGVSEENVQVNTRMCLEKGITLVGNSRCSKSDYEDLIKILNNHSKIIGYLRNIVSGIYSVRNIKDINNAFEMDSIKDYGKTVINWDV